VATLSIVSSRRPHRLMTLLAGLIVASVPRLSSAAATDETNTLQEVTVTAQRRTERLRTCRSRFKWSPVKRWRSRITIA